MKTKTDELIAAIAKPDLTLVNQLLEEGVNIDAMDANEMTPLHRAIQSCHFGACYYEIVELLIAKGANLEQIATSRKRSPLELALKVGFRGCNVRKEFSKRLSSLNNCY